MRQEEAASRAWEAEEGARCEAERCMMGEEEEHVRAYREEARQMWLRYSPAVTRGQVSNLLTTYLTHLTIY